MSVTINQSGIDALAKNPGVIQFIEDTAKAKAEKIVGTIKENISGKEGYFREAEFTSPDKDVANDVGYRDEGEGAVVIGIVDGYDGEGKSKAQRIVSRPDLFPAWLRTALEAEGFEIT